MYDFVYFKGVEEIDQIFTVLLKTNTAVGGILALILDNIIPGTPEERGIQKWRSLVTSNRGKSIATVHVYDLPFGFISKWKISKYIPFLPYYGEQHTDVEMSSNGVLNMGASEENCVDTISKTNSSQNHHTSL